MGIRKPRPRAQIESVRSPTGTILDTIQEDVSGVFKGFDALPHMPHVLASLQQALSSGHSDAQHIAHLVGSDVGLTAQILRVVNSAYYGLRRQILDLRYAVAYLGFDEVYRIVLTVSVVNGLGVKDGAAVRGFWHHSFYTALVAKYLVGIYDRLLDPGDLWPAALLHDVGQLVYLRLYPKHFAAIRAYQETHGCSTTQAEDSLCMPSHAMMGSLLAERWSLPDVIRDVCEHHELEDPMAVGGSEEMIAFRRMVSAASTLTDIADGHLSPEVTERASRNVRKLLRVSSKDFISLMAQVYDLRTDADEFTRDIP